MVVIQLRIIDIINNYRHCVVIPSHDVNGRRIRNKRKVLDKVLEGDYKFIVFPA